MPTQTIITRSLLILMCSALMGCSGVRLAYNNPDWTGAWFAGRYVTLETQQRAQLQQQMLTLQRWHCQEELPVYLERLEQFNQDWQQAQVTEDRLLAYWQDVQSAYQRVMQKTVEPSAHLLRTFSDEQVQMLLTSMMRNLNKDQASLTEAQAIEERYQRMEERLSQWLGPLLESQQQLIQAWSQQRQHQPAYWRENRYKWQTAFAEVLQQRHTDNFSADLSSLFLTPQSYYDESRYQQQLEAQQQTFHLLLQVFQQADKQQRQHLSTEIQGWQQIMTTLVC